MIISIDTLSPIIAEYLEKRKESKRPDEHPDLSKMTLEEEAAWRQALMDHNSPFAIKMAKNYARNEEQFKDLVQASLFGMWKAAQRYDPEHSNKFITYAIWWCRAFIIEELSIIAEQCRIPLNAFRAWTPDADRAAKMFTSLNTPIDEKELGDFLEQFTFARPDHDIIAESESEVVDRFLSGLDDRSERIVRGYFGIGCDAQRLEEMRHEFGISRERARQIKEQALDAVRMNVGGRYNDLWDRAREVLDNEPNPPEVKRMWRYNPATYIRRVK